MMAFGKSDKSLVIAKSLIVASVILSLYMGKRFNISVWNYDKGNPDFQQHFGQH